MESQPREQNWNEMQNASWRMVPRYSLNVRSLGREWVHTVLAALTHEFNPRDKVLEEVLRKEYKISNKKKKRRETRHREKIN